MTKEERKENTFFMPAEWQMHKATWLAWPNNDDYFKGRFSNIEKMYVQIIAHLHKGELIKLMVLNQKEQDRISSILGKAGVNLSQIIFYQSDYTDVWIRDYGPTFVDGEGGIYLIKWRYDGYNNQFPELLKDDKIFFNLKNSIGLPMHEIDFAMESGAFEVNGAGTLLTTAQCLLQNRNKGKTKEDYEKVFSEILGVTNFIWLNQGLLNDHTNGHIDEVARFVSPSKILCAFEEDEQDGNHTILAENFKILESAIDQEGKKFKVIKLPTPHVLYDNGMKAPASYANFYVGNNVVLVPGFNDPNDERAPAIIGACFPDREVVSVNCLDILYGGGAIHCITNQEPA